MPKYLMKVIVFGAVCGVTWVVATPLRARLLSAPSAPVVAPSVPQPFPVTPFVGDGIKQEGVVALPPGSYTPEPKDYKWLKHFDVTVVNGRAEVVMETRVKEGTPGLAYLWMARIVSENGQELQRIPYDHQIFSPPVGLEVTPSFRDSLPVPRGRSRVVVGLYRFDETGAEAAHGTGEEAVPYLVLQTSKMVTAP